VGCGESMAWVRDTRNDSVVSCRMESQPEGDGR
jgi:hypothetical protein